MGFGRSTRARAATARVPAPELDRLLADPDERLVAVVQPLVDLRTGFVSGYEALSRFPGSDRAPQSWFALARSSGRGVELELLAAGRQLRLAGRPPGARLSVNLSATALARADLDAHLGDDLSGLILEVTEDELVAVGPSLERRLRSLRARGARLAVDDIGAGYAGLSQVVRLRPDLLKVDRSLVDGVAADPAKTAMIDALVRFARRMGAEVCAEGIETVADLRALADLDVTYGQGHVLCPPRAPWPSVDPVASRACVSALRAVIDHDDTDWVATSAERGLEHVCRMIARIRFREELHVLLDPLRRLLGVDGVALSILDGSGAWLETVADGTSEGDDHRYRLDDYPATVELLRTGTALQVLASDPDADPAEVATMGRLGFRSLLMVPLMAGGRGLGLLEAYAREERPWSRTDIHSARILSYQLGPVLAGAPTRASARP